MPKPYPPIVALGGFMDSAPCLPWATSLSRELAPLEATTQLIHIRAPRWLNNWRKGDWLHVSANCPSKYIALGYSDGAPIALELAANDHRCCGLVFLSGLATTIPHSGWRNYPALIGWHLREAHSLRLGSYTVFTTLLDCHARARKHVVSTSAWLPHMLGATPHLPAIQAWLANNY